MAFQHGLNSHQTKCCLSASNVNSRDDSHQEQNQDKKKDFGQQHLVDVRMKRHPELVPYMPPERDSKTLLSKNGSTNNRQAETRKTTLAAHEAKSNKKYFSSTRLDKLAQPKKDYSKNHVPNRNTNSTSSITTTNAPSTVSSISSTSNARKKDNLNNIKTKPHVFSPKQKKLVDLESQVSEISISECLYQSANSDIIRQHQKKQECNETHTIDTNSSIDDGSNKDREGNSFRELEADLLAAGLIQSQVKNEPEYDWQEPPLDQEQANSSEKIAIYDDIDDSLSEVESKAIPVSTKEDDERRMREEEELRAAAKKQEEERMQRLNFVEGIMRRVSKPGSPPQSVSTLLQSSPKQYFDSDTINNLSNGRNL